jgi:U3 small nucleolar RNA-associated protein 21
MAARAASLNLTGSQVFSPFRGLGCISNGVPLALQALGSEHFVATVVGRSFHLYNVSIYYGLL